MGSAGRAGDQAAHRARALRPRAARGVPIALARAGVEITVLIVGWFLGGSVGVATVVFATTIGALVKVALHRLARGPAVAG
jgi:uncharacterized membrane protein YczE